MALRAWRVVAVAMLAYAVVACGSRADAVDRRAALGKADGVTVSALARGFDPAVVPVRTNGALSLVARGGPLTTPEPGPFGSPPMSGLATLAVALLLAVLVTLRPHEPRSLVRRRGPPPLLALCS